MKKWALILHMYQPPTQSLEIVREVLRSCYIPMLKLINNTLGIAVTLNVSGGLLQLIDRLERRDFFDLLRLAVKSGRIELLNSPVYHTIIPLTPESIVVRQLEKNAQILSRMVGAPEGGIFPPELAVNEKSVLMLAKLGDYVIVDETAIGRTGLATFKKVKLVATNRRLCEVLRSYPGKLTAAKISKLIKMTPAKSIVSVHDIEIFGHHYSERMEMLGELFRSKEINFVTVGSLVKSGEQIQKVGSVMASDWQIAENFATWEGNELQMMYLELAKKANELYEKYRNKITGHTRDSATKHLDMGWSSCHFYWLSNKPWWHPDLVGKGAENLVRCIRSLPATKEEKTSAEGLYHTFLEKMWRYHWSGKVEEGYRAYEIYYQKMVSQIKITIGESL